MGGVLRSSVPYDRRQKAPIELAVTSLHTHVSARHNGDKLGLAHLPPVVRNRFLNDRGWSSTARLVGPVRNKRRTEGCLCLRKLGSIMPNRTVTTSAIMEIAQMVTTQRITSTARWNMTEKQMENLAMHGIEAMIVVILHHMIYTLIGNVISVHGVRNTTRKLMCTKKRCAKTNDVS